MQELKERNELSIYVFKTRDFEREGRFLKGYFHIVAAYSYRTVVEHAV